MTTPLSGIGPVVVPLAEGPSKSNTLTQKSCNPCGQGVENNPGVYRISNPNPHLLQNQNQNQKEKEKGKKKKKEEARQKKMQTFIISKTI